MTRPVILTRHVILTRRVILIRRVILTRSVILTRCIILTRRVILTRGRHVTRGARMHVFQLRIVQLFSLFSSRARNYFPAYFPEIITLIYFIYIFLHIFFLQNCLQIQSILYTSSYEAIFFYAKLFINPVSFVVLLKFYSIVSFYCQFFSSIEEKINCQVDIML